MTIPLFSLCSSNDDLFNSSSIFMVANRVFMKKIGKIGKMNCNFILKIIDFKSKTLCPNPIYYCGVNGHSST